MSQIENDLKCGECCPVDIVLGSVAVETGRAFDHVVNT